MANALLGKWLPRKPKNATEAKFIADLRKHLDLSPKQYRKILMNLTKVVETQMCAKDWDSINFDHVPSVASARYQKAFGRHCTTRYAEYKAGLVKVNPETGETERKINAGAVYPYDVIKSIDSGDRDVARAQWNALPNYLGDNMILPMVDVSGSMTAWSYYGHRNKPKATVTPMQIALSLGLYVANKQQGPFNGMWLTFSSNPRLERLTGDIVNMKNEMQTGHWEMSTNFERAFMEILRVARNNNVPQEEMPKILLVLSDMEFDAARGGTNYQTASTAFENAGYNLPKIVFWAINGRSDNVPVSFRQDGTALVSGFSPTIFKSVLSGDLSKFTPESVMMETIMNPRYDIEGLTT